MVENKFPDGEIREQRRGCLCKLTKFAGTAGITVTVWSLVPALDPNEKTLGENEPIDVFLAGVAAGQTVRHVWRGKLILIHHHITDEIITARSIDLDALIDPQLDNARVSATHPQWLVVQSYRPHVGYVPNARPGGEGWARPCHDSELDTSGRVIYGSATADLVTPDYVIHSSGQIVRVSTKEA